jgi:hypothetical protein
MQIPDEALLAHGKLSDCSLKFLEFVEKCPESLVLSNFDLLELNDELFKLHPWPTFIDERCKSELKEAAEKTYRLMASIPGRIFQDDPVKISRYFNIPLDEARWQIEGISDELLQNLISRGDFLLSPAGIKCLEYNVTCNLGGLQVPFWESLYLNVPVILNFLTDYRINIVNKNLVSSFFDHLIEFALNRFSAYEGPLNTAMVVPGYDPVFKGRIEVPMRVLYKRSLSRLAANRPGEMVICSCRELRIEGGRVFCRDHQLHVMAEFCFGAVPPEIIEVFKRGDICLLNGPIGTLLSNKLNLAVLSEAEDSDIFSEAERETIRTYIPWTRKLIPGDTTFHNDRLNLEKFVLQNRQKVVLKPSTGYGGKGIHIGKKTSPQEWAELIHKALAEGTWLVQEYFDSLPYIYQWGDNDYAIHDAAWGFFVFGTTYAGGWVRVMPRANNKGVINCHQGARVSVLFEVEA